MIIMFYRRNHTTHNMQTQQWLDKCKDWTLEDDHLFEKGMKSGTAINRHTGKPITKQDIIKMHESLPY